MYSKKSHTSCPTDLSGIPLLTLGGARLCTHKARSHNSIQHEAHAHSQCQSNAPINPLSSSCRANPSLRLSDQGQTQNITLNMYKAAIVSPYPVWSWKTPIVELTRCPEGARFSISSSSYFSLPYVWRGSNLAASYRDLRTFQRYIRASACSHSWATVCCVIFIPQKLFPGANLNNDITLEKMANYLKNLMIRLGEWKDMEAAH